MKESAPVQGGEGQPIDGGAGRRPPDDGILLFAGDGRLVATTASSRGLFDPPVADLADLERRYRRVDGTALDLARRGRHVALPTDGSLVRVLLISEPLVSLEAPSDGPSLAVAVLPFGDENDPQTLQMALGSVLAHELRTPMTTVYAGAELIASGGVSEPAREEAARVVARAAGQLHRVVEDLVLLVRPVREDDEPEPLLLAPILRAEAERRAEPGLSIDVGVPADLPPILGHPPLVEHLIRNVLDHAATNSPPGGRVSVVARLAAPFVEISVTDEGPPRDREARERALALFATTRRQGADPSGANLGLVAARRLVERLNGRIAAGSPVRGGEIVVALPAAIEPTNGPL